MTTIYVGNLPFNATEQDLRALFESHGTVESVKLINDRETATSLETFFSKKDLDVAEKFCPVACGHPAKK